MKIALIVLTLYFSVTFISAFSLFGVRSHEKSIQTTRSARNDQLASQQRFAVRPQQQSQLKNSTDVPQKAVSASNKVQLNQSPSQRVVNQRKHHVHNNTTVVPRQAVSRNTNHKQVIQRNRTNGIANRRQQQHFHNTTVIPRQAEISNMKSSQVVQQNHVKHIAHHQQQQQALNNSAPIRQNHRAIPNTNNRIAHSRLQSFHRTGRKNHTTVVPTNQRSLAQIPLSKSVLADSKSNNASNTPKEVQPNRFQWLFGKTIVKSTKTHHNHTPQTTANNNKQQGRRISVNDSQQKQLRTSHNATHVHPKVNSVVKQRNRRDRQDDMSDSIILSRTISSSEDN